MSSDAIRPRISYTEDVARFTAKTFTEIDT